MKVNEVLGLVSPKGLGYFGSPEFMNIVDRVHNDLENSNIAVRDTEYGDRIQVGRKIRAILSDPKYRYLSQAIKEKIVHALSSFYGIDEPTYQTGEVQY